MPTRSIAKKVDSQKILRNRQKPTSKRGNYRVMKGGKRVRKA